MGICCGQKLERNSDPAGDPGHSRASTSTVLVPVSYASTTVASTQQSTRRETKKETIKQRNYVMKDLRDTESPAEQNEARGEDKTAKRVH